MDNLYDSHDLLTFYKNIYPIRNVPANTGVRSKMASSNNFRTFSSKFHGNKFSWNKDTRFGWKINLLMR